MPIERRNLHAAGVLIGYLRDDTGQLTNQRGPIGTFFNLMVPSNETGWAHPYMVAAAHVVMEQSDIEARLRALDGELLAWSVNHWVFPDDPLLDLALRPLDSTRAGPNAVAAVPADQAMDLSAPGKAPKLGSKVYFFGVLSAKGAESMGLEAVPVLRTGNVAQLDQPKVTWDGLTAEYVHLIDVRSRGGFSGSPCFAQFSFPGPRPADTTIPEPWERSIRDGGGDPDALGEVHTITAWWGMFVAHVDESGIGVVLPTQFILEFLRTESFMEMQRQQDEAVASRTDEPEIKPQGAGSTQSQLDRDKFMLDLRKATRRLPEQSENEES